MLVLSGCNLHTGGQFLTLGCSGIFNFLQNISSALTSLRALPSWPSTLPDLYAGTQRPNSLAMFTYPCMDADTQLHLYSTPSVPQAFLLFSYHFSYLHCWIGCNTFYLSTTTITPSKMEQGEKKEKKKVIPTRKGCLTAVSTVFLISTQPFPYLTFNPDIREIRAASLVTDI